LSESKVEKEEKGQLVKEVGMGNPVEETKLTFFLN